ncbi:hypothetical protein [Xanthocytophaga agilis]|uniref:Uncharacterized protein n=1 Tax=Xanthocytophaga agilis TaxID=3048010 RepID=A0AAE3R4F0_9BACT|nr:hypothetical protein [Xanthocytophaga agilis]MDJ1500482.1 hypothetical protein [Xanthocytophaga agilis]
MQLAVHIPVKPHIHSYLKSKYGSDRILLRGSKQDPIAQYVASKISKPAKVQKVSENKHTCKITFLVSKDFFEKVGCLVDNEAAIHFNFFVDHLIKQEFYTHMYLRLAYGVCRKDAIIEFMERYDLHTDGLTYEALKKAFYRFEKKNNVKIFGNIVPSVGENKQEPTRTKSTNPNTIRWHKWKAKQRRLSKMKITLNLN